MPRGTRTKPAKPYPAFPLFPHANGLWAKKIRGRLRYFGPWRDPQAALNRYLAERDELHAGREPRDAGATTIGRLCNQFLAAKQRAVRADELSGRTWANYKEITDRLVTVLGATRPVETLAPTDFAVLRAAMATTHGPTALASDVTKSRVVFRWGVENGLLASPPRYGSEFGRPSARTLRVHAASRPPRFFEADELRRLLHAADYPLKAMLLLGINCGFGNRDIATLGLAALDLDGGWCVHPRPKTGIERRCPLWPETVKRLRRWLADGGRSLLAFPRARGRATLAHMTLDLCRACGLHRNGRGFYALRHTFQTVAEESGDFPAVSYLMGHAPAASDMAAVYRRRISDERLRRVVETVRGWLFG